MVFTVAIEVEEDGADQTKNFRPTRRIECKLTTDHAQSSYGQPVLVMPDGSVFGACDVIQGARAKAWVAVTQANATYRSDSQEFALIDRFRVCDPIQAAERAV